MESQQDKCAENSETNQDINSTIAQFSQKAMADDDSVYADCNETTSDLEDFSVNTSQQKSPKARKTVTRTMRKRRRTDQNTDTSYSRVRTLNSTTDAKIDSLIHLLSEAEKRFDSKISQIANSVEAVKNDIAGIDGLVQQKVDARMQQLTSELNETSASMNQKIATLINDVTKLSTSVSELEDKQDTTATNSESVPATEYQVLQNKISDLERKLEEQSETIKQQGETTSKKLEKLETHGRKLNLVFENVPEKPGENCKHEIERIIRGQMRLHVNDPIDIAHRLEKTDHRKPAGIIARFKTVSEKSRILQNSSLLRGTNIYVRNDYPTAVTQRRSYLAKVLNDAKRQDRNARLVQDRLCYRGTYYTAETVHTAGFPTHGHIKETENQVRFYGYMAFLSNFHRAKFDFNGIQFSSSEKAYQYARAMARNNGFIARKILNEDNPVLIKRLAKGLRMTEGYNADRDIEIMKEVVQAKFAANNDLQQKLLATGTKKIIECNPYDVIYSSGLHLDDPQLDSGRFRGKNQLGQILEAVRSGLQTDN